MHTVPPALGRVLEWRPDRLAPGTGVPAARAALGGTGAPECQPALAQTGHRSAEKILLSAQFFGLKSLSKDPKSCRTAVYKCFHADKSFFRSPNDQCELIFTIKSSFFWDGHYGRYGRYVPALAGTGHSSAGLIWALDRH